MNERHAKFVAATLRGLNGKEAAIAAGFTDHSANRTAVRLLKHPAIAAAIAKGKEEQADQRRVTADRVLLEYARIAFSDMRNYVDWDGNGLRLHPKETIDDWEAGAIARHQRQGRQGPAARQEGGARHHRAPCRAFCAERQDGRLRPNRRWRRKPPDDRRTGAGANQEQGREQQRMT
jgi:hypothetical protein